MVSLAPGGQVRYVVSLAPGDFLELRVEQEGLDVTLSLPGTGLPPVDLSYGRFVPERLLWYAPEGGRQIIHLDALEGDGVAQVVVDSLGPASERDRRRARAFWRTWNGVSAARESPRDGLRLLERAAEEWSESKDPLGEAIARVEACRVLWLSGDYGRALDRCDRAVERSREAKEPVLIARFRFARALAWRAWSSSGQAPNPGDSLDRALEDYLAAREGARETGDRYLEGIAAVSAGTVHWMRSAFDPALRFYDEARQILDGIDEHEAAAAHLALGRTQMRLGDSKEALSHLLIAFASASLRGEWEQRAAAEREIGWWYHLNDAPERALKILGALDDQVSRARRVRVLISSERYDEARALLSSLETTVGGYRAVQIEADRCVLEARSGDPKEAREACRRALEGLRAHGDPGGEPWVLAWSALATAREGDLVMAERAASDAVARLEAQRAAAGRPRWRMAFLAERLLAYRLLVDLRMELHQRHPTVGWDHRALEVAESIRSRTLRELLASEGVADSLVLTSPREREHLEKLDRRSRELANWLFAAVSEDGPWNRRSVLERIEEQLRKVLASVDEARRSADSSATAPPLASESLDLEAIRSLLDTRTTVLFYHLGESQSYVWAVRRDTVEGRILVSREEIVARARAWYETLADPWGDLDPTIERRQARALSEVLLDPVADQLEHTERLVVVGDGLLRLVPFSAMPRPGTRGSEPVMVDFTVSTLPSLAILPTLRSRASSREPASGLLAIFADPVYDEDERAPIAALKRDRPLERLPSTIEEARRIEKLASAYGNTMLVEGHEATRARFLRGDLATYRIVHVAGHALTRTVPRGLVLSRWDRRGRAQPDIVGFQELYGLELPVELAVASACSTGLGEEVPGEGLIGLTRGFMQAGVPRVIVSLWEVRDQATAELMVHFYNALLEGREAPADALRSARLALYRRPDSDIRDWSAFVYQGDWFGFPLPARIEEIPRQQDRTPGVH